MAKFGINDLINIKNRAETASEYQEIWLSPYEVKPSESNFYSQEKIEELADSFLAVGQQQPTVLARVDGEFRIVSGHRRNLANIRNLERGYEDYQKVRYLYKDMSQAMLELSLLIGNAYNRELTAWEKTQQAQRLKEALIRAREEEGLEIPGKLRDVIADLMKESSSNIAKMNSINKNAAPEIKEEFKKGNLGITAAYEAAKLPSEKQKVIARKSAEGQSVPIKEITEKVKVFETNPSREEMVKVLPEKQKVFETNPLQEQPAREVSKETEVFETNPLRNEPVKEMTGKRKSISRHMQILQEWGRAEAGIPIVTKSVSRAMEKVFETNPVKSEWTNTDWAVFISKGILHCADYVSEEDLYLLHDIRLRCQERKRDME